jgi:hypothetical protein
VQLLDDEREAVRTKVRELLRAQVARSLLERQPAQLQMLALLIHELALQPLPRDAREQAFVKQTAMKLLYWPTEDLGIEGGQVLLDCTSLLQRLTTPLPEQVRIAERTEKLYEPPVFERVLPQEQEIVPPAPPATIEVAPLPTPPVSVTLSDEPADSLPGVMPLEGNESRLPPDRFYPQSPDKLRSGASGSLSDDIESESPNREPFVNSATEPNVLPATELDLTKFRELSTRALIRHLHGLPEIAQAAEKLLRERGFDDATIPLAYKLDDPDPRVRKELVEALPGMANLHAASWLFELTRDRDPAVSAAAKSILSTSRNPFTQRRLQLSPMR